MNEEGTTNGKKELVSHAVILFDGKADALDKRTRDIRVGDDENKFTITFPVPTNDDEAKAYYNSSIADLVADGCRQRTYDADNSLRNLIAEKREAGVDPMEYLDQVASDMEEALTTPKAKKVSEAKKIKEAKASTGMSVDEMIALAKKAKEAGLDTE